MHGWKTLVSGLLSILWGVWGFAVGLHDADAGAGFIIAGLALLGLGHKVDKMTAHTQDLSGALLAALAFWRHLSERDAYHSNRPREEERI